MRIFVSFFGETSACYFIVVTDASSLLFVFLFVSFFLFLSFDVFFFSPKKRMKILILSFVYRGIKMEVRMIFPRFVRDKLLKNEFED